MEVELGDSETMMVLRFWAQGVDILQKFTKEQVMAVPGLKEAIYAVWHWCMELGGTELIGYAVTAPLKTSIGYAQVRPPSPFQGQVSGPKLA
jgi:hypothetical protein